VAGRCAPAAVESNREISGPLFCAEEPRVGVSKEVTDLFGTSVQVAGAGVSNAGRPRLPIRLMVALLYLKHAYNESDESVAERWSQDVYFQFFSGPEHFEPRLPCDATQIGRFRSAIGEAGVEEILKATSDTTVATQAVKPQDFERVIVDTTVQEKAIAFPTDSRLLEIARYQLVKAAKAAGTPHDAPAPCERRARGLRVKTWLTCSWLDLLKSWSLLKTRGGSGCISCHPTVRD
jgi:hypothetical protein